MSSIFEPPASPRVVAVVVVRDGARWLPDVLTALGRSRYADLDVVAVDNASTDASAAILAERLSPERVITLDRDAGFGGAVTAALEQSPTADRAELLLLLHDDLLLADDAVDRLVAALDEDRSVDIVGPKLRDRDDPETVQQVGLTIDRLGRAESRIEPGELDQGQHDTQRAVLAVSTAAMLIRRDLLRRVGFDPRFTVFRDDVDLCWRTWLAGGRVEVVPAAIGYHAAAASRAARPVGRGRRGEPRYLAERHTLALLLKSYSLRQLLWVLPAALVVGVLKVLGFLATRRFGDAVATVRAYGWNVVQLPATLRRRRVVQRNREVADIEILGLFAKGLPRLRIYAEAIGSWVAGGGTRALLEEERRRPAVEDRTAWHAIREHPARWVGLTLLALYLIGVAGLLGPGPLVGGEIAPWPDEAADYLRAYVNPVHGEPLASDAFTSPAQAVLGLASLLGFGSAWLAERVVVLGLLPLAWLLALRAGRLVTRRPGPRVLGATLYVISPVLLGALREGRLSVLVVAALLPGLLLVGVRAIDPLTDAAGGWRAAAFLSLGLVVAVAMAPQLLPLLCVCLLGLTAAAASRGRRGIPAVLRMLGAGILALLILSPWLAALRSGAATVSDAALGGTALPLWQALALAPGSSAALGPLGAPVVVALSLAIVLAAVWLGLRVRPLAVAALLAVWAASSLAAWAVATLPAAGAVAMRLGLPGAELWVPALLLPAALAQAGLGILAGRWLVGRRADRPSGVRRAAPVLVSLVVLVGLLGGVLHIASGPVEGVRRDAALLPAFVTAESERVGPYRVVVIEETDGVVRWDVTADAGPSMLGYGAAANPSLELLLQQAIGVTVSGGDPSGGRDLGLANVRYLVIAQGAASLDLIATINRQPELEPLPADGTLVWRVRPWLPRAVALPPARAQQLVETGDPGDTADLEEDGLARDEAGRYSGAIPTDAAGGLLVLSEGADVDWRAVADRRRVLTPVELGAVQAFALDDGGEPVVIAPRRQPAHLLLLVGQLLLVGLVASVILRPPGTRRRRTLAAARPGTLTQGPDLLGAAPRTVAPSALVERPAVAGSDGPAPAVEDGGAETADRRVTERTVADRAVVERAAAEGAVAEERR
jgi:GT2 family glycosyltransferase